MTRARSTLRMVIAISSLIIIGAALGITADRMLHGRGDPQMSELRRIQEDPVGAIDRIVQLRPEQRERVATILAARQTMIDSAWHDVHNQLLATLDTVVNEIAAALDPEQAAAFRTYFHETHQGVPRPMH
jgi:hypothetical protein